MKLLKIPYPYKAWLTIANDPDNTTVENWRELHQFLWEELKLPISDALFVTSHNQNLPDQVNLVEHPFIAASHPHESLHTWGDYMHSRKCGFDREDALAAIDRLQSFKIAPAIWIDHAQFEGNIVNFSRGGGIRDMTDMSGHKYNNYKYTLDLIIERLGIKYFWDGELTPIVGQDRTLRKRDYYYEISGSPLKAIIKWGVSIIMSLPYRNKAGWRVPDNSQYKRCTFLDDHVGYTFTRYGTWADADIYGLGRIISPQRINRLINTGGTCVVYTHLGKRPANKLLESTHIPECTRDALKYLKHCYEQELVMISPLSELLDYLVIRDHIVIDHTGMKLFFKADGIRFPKLSKEDLKGMKVSFHVKRMQPTVWRVYVDNVFMEHPMWRRDSDDIQTLLF